MTYSGALVESDTSGERRRAGSSIGASGAGGAVSGLTTRTLPSWTPRSNASWVSNCSAPAKRGSLGSVRGGRGEFSAFGGERSGG